MKKIITLMLAIGLFSFSAHSFAQVQDSTKTKKTKEKKVKTTVATTTATPVIKPTVAPKATTTTTTTTVKSTDKVFGTDAKGRTIYEGKEGGHYYMSTSNKKVYVKKTP